MRRRANLRVTYFLGGKQLWLNYYHGRESSRCGLVESTYLPIWTAPSIFVGMLAVFFLLINPPLHLIHEPIRATTGSDTVCVPGRGFSGFWYSLGHLHAMRDHVLNDSRDYYCYSSGCLSVTASMSNRTVDELIDVAVKAQELWRDGNISRFDIVEVFLDNIVPSLTNNGVIDKLHILLTTTGVGGTARRAHTLDELRDLLIQTTWIPFVTGSSLWVEDDQGRYHMDGAFSTTLHPPCTHQIGAPNSYEMVVNSLNPSLSSTKAKEYWQAGFQYGVETIANEGSPADISP